MSSGCSIQDIRNDTLINGVGLNPGYWFDGSCFAASYPGGVKNMFFVQAPDDTTTYYLFHFAAADDPVTISGSGYTIGYNFYYSRIRRSQVTGTIDTVEAVNQVILQDSFSLGQIGACRHANGRDWWIVKPHFLSNKHFVFLLTPSGITLDHTQNIGVFDEYEGDVGGASFSPNGQKYARFSVQNGLNLMDFDRCTGLFSNPWHQEYVFTTADTFPIVGSVNFSPNSRFLYVNEQVKIWQYDLAAANIADSKVPILTFTNSTGSANFGQLAADGRIYYSGTSSQQYLHYIAQPDESGITCDYRPKGLILPAHNHGSLPYFPNYRLGPIDGSACDTLGIDNIPLAWFRYDIDDPAELYVPFRDLSSYEPTSWLWDFGDGTSSTEQHPGHDYDSVGTYQVCLIVSNANGADTFCRVLNLGVSSTDESGTDAGIQVSPNPFGDYLYVTVNALLPEAELLLYDLRGQLIRRSQLLSGVNEIDTKDLQSGLYIWHISSRFAWMRSGKLIKMGK